VTEKNYSLDGLNKFVDYVIEKGLMKPETAKARKRAANSILGVLAPSEVEDLRTIDVDHISQRFANLQGTGFKPASLKVYQSRLKSVLADFFQYVEDPINFKPSVNTRSSGGGEKKAKTGKTKEKTITNSDPHSNSPAATHHLEAEKHGNLVFPIPIRPGLIVKLSNIPDNLTQAEAEKISAVIKALAMLE